MTEGPRAVKWSAEQIPSARVTGEANDESGDDMLFGVVVLVHEQRMSRQTKSMP